MLNPIVVTLGEVNFETILFKEKFENEYLPATTGNSVMIRRSHMNTSTPILITLEWLFYWDLMRGKELEIMITVIENSISKNFIYYEIYKHLNYLVLI